MGLDNKGSCRARESRSPNSTRDIDSDILFELLAEPQRRTLIQYCVDNEADRIDVDELTEYLYSNCSTNTTSHADILTTLHHIHLPKLEHADIVEYDPDGHTVTYLGSDVLERVLTVSGDI